MADNKESLQSHPTRASVVEKVGDIFASAFSGIVSLVTFGNSKSKLLRKNLAYQILFTGVDSLLIVSIVSLLLGAFFLTWLNFTLVYIGATQYMGMLLVAAVVREAVPLAIVLVLTVRSAPAICIEMAYMKLRNEFEALKVMGIDQGHYLILPRIVGVVVASGCLVVFATFISLIGGILITSLWSRINIGTLVPQVLSALKPGDIWFSVIKTVVISAIVIMIAYFQGRQVKMSITEVPDAVSKALVRGLVIGVSLGILASAVYYLFIIT